MLSRFVPRHTGITVVASAEIGPVGVGEATIPQIRLLTSGLGIDEQRMLAATQGTYKLGIEFVDWGALGERYMHGFGQIGRGLGVTPFHHYWLRGRTSGVTAALGNFVPTIQAAAEARFGRSGAPIDLAYAFHFDARLLGQFLREIAVMQGVRQIEGRIGSVARSVDGDVATLLLEDGRRVEGDFYLDCSGFAAVLIGKALGVGYEDWSHWLPCDRAVAVASSGNATLPPYTRATARSVGWQWRIPLQHRVGNGLVYASDALSDDEAAGRLLGSVDGQCLGDPRQLRFVTGKRHRFWERNVVALGLASGFLEPLESTSIHLVQSALARLFELFPSRVPDPAARESYNTKAHAEIDRIRDFLILHYHANRRNEPFWQASRNREIPPELQEKLRQFRASGRMVRDTDELFTDPGWVQVMIGQGIVPDRWSPLADGLSDEELAHFLTSIARSVARQVAELPFHGDFVARHCPAAVIR